MPQKRQNEPYQKPSPIWNVSKYDHCYTLSFFLEKIVPRNLTKMYFSENRIFCENGPFWFKGHFYVISCPILVGVSFSPKFVIFVKKSQMKWTLSKTWFNFKCSKINISAVVSRGDDSVTAADMGLALTYAQTITQILNFLIRVTAELEVNVRYENLWHDVVIWCHVIMGHMMSGRSDITWLRHMWRHVLLIK